MRLTSTGIRRKLLGHTLSHSQFARRSCSARATAFKTVGSSTSLLIVQPSQRSYSTLKDSLKSFKPGNTVHGFIVTRVKDIKDFDLTAIQLKHGKTGADYIHILKEDSNNVFNVGFKTAPMDSTGVPHILEHTALCGSKKYPVRDPFFKMLNRSMSTFMNAMTGNDITMYPFSTENPTDFDNLFDVYMDAAFFPLLRNLDFKQEGWRLEHEVPTDPSTPIIFKGVVYNEMKGVFSDVNNIFLQRLQQSLYPDTTYGYVSGGDPINITDLTHKDLVEFHRKHYHPSNSMFVTYGNFPLEHHLEQVNNRISGFDRIQPVEIKGVEPFSSPKDVHISCPPDAMGDKERQTRMCLTYLMNDGTDGFESFAVRMLSTLLTDGAASPMYRALIESNIGTDYAASTGYDRSIRQTSFSVGLQGIRSDDVSLVERKINETFKEAASKGFETDRVESAIHQLELGIRHRLSNFGLGLSQSVLQQWVHGGDPVEALEVTKQISRLRSEMKDPTFFRNRIEKYFLHNNHNVRFVMQPSESYNSEVEAEEVARLQEHVTALTSEDKTKIYEDGLALLKMQETKEDISCLPTLTIEDVPEVGKVYPVYDNPLPSSYIPVQWRETKTNGISYVTVSRSLSGLREDLLPFVPLYCGALAALGTQKTPSVPELDERIRRFTSGISASPNIATNPQDTSQVDLSVHYGTSALDANLEPAVGLLAEVIENLAFSNILWYAPGTEVFERLRTVVAGAASGGMNSLAHAGHRYAVGVAAKGLAPASGLKEKLGGVESVVFLNQLFAKGDAGIKECLEKIKEISEFLVTAPAATKMSVVCSPESVSANEQQLEKLVATLGWSHAADNKVGELKTQQPVFKSTFLPLPFTVNYTARVFKGVPYTHEDGASLLVLGELLTNEFLHKEIREKGGAYGAFSNYNAADGYFSMASYRDPPGAGVRTMDAYDRALQWALGISKNVGERELNEAKLSILSSMDKPMNAGQEGSIRFSSGIDDRMRQRRREQLFEVTLESVEKAAQTYLGSAQGHSNAVLGPSDETLHSKTQWVVKKVQ